MEKNEVTLDDVKKKVSQINLVLAEQMKSQKVKIYLVAGTTITVAILTAYLIGRRSGRK